MSVADLRHADSQESPEAPDLPKLPGCMLSSCEGDSAHPVSPGCEEHVLPSGALAAFQVCGEAQPGPAIREVEVPLLFHETPQSQPSRCCAARLRN